MSIPCGAALPSSTFALKIISSPGAGEHISHKKTEARVGPLGFDYSFRQRRLIYLMACNHGIELFFVDQHHTFILFFKEISGYVQIEFAVPYLSVEVIVIFKAEKVQHGREQMFQILDAAGSGDALFSGHVEKSSAAFDVGLFHGQRGEIFFDQPLRFRCAHAFEPFHVRLRVAVCYDIQMIEQLRLIAYVDNLLIDQCLAEPIADLRPHEVSKIENGGCFGKFEPPAVLSEHKYFLFEHHPRHDVTSVFFVASACLLSEILNDPLYQIHAVFEQILALEILPRREIRHDPQRFTCCISRDKIRTVNGRPCGPRRLVSIIRFKSIDGKLIVS